MLTGVALLLALLIGLATSAEWQTLLLFQHQATEAAIAAAAAGPGAATAVGSVVDPVFGQPLTFYLFDMPFFRAAAEAIGSILDALIVLTGIAYLALARRSMSRPNGRLWAWHLGILIGLRVAIGAVGFQLDKFSLAFQQRAVPAAGGRQRHGRRGAHPGRGPADDPDGRGRGRGAAGHRPRAVHVGGRRRSPAGRWSRSRRDRCWRS